MSDSCQLVVFSNKAYNAIIRESFDKDPVETGGILLGHVLDNGIWIVMEVLPPGINSIFEYAYFEYDEDFVNYLAQSVANQYKQPLDVLGLWHRHPGNMNVFSTTDDGTNETFARQNPAGVISALVNIDPDFHITMYHLDHITGRVSGRPHYERVDIEVGDDIIPEDYFELRYYNGEGSEMHPRVEERRQERSINRTINDVTRKRGEDSGSGGDDVQKSKNYGSNDGHDRERATPKVVDDFFYSWRASNKKWMFVLIAVIAIVAFVFAFRFCSNAIFSDQAEQTEQTVDEDTERPKEKKDRKENRSEDPSLSMEEQNSDPNLKPDSKKYTGNPEPENSVNESNIMQNMGWPFNNNGEESSDPENNGSEKPSNPF